MADSVDPLSLYRDASRDLLQEVKPAAEPAAVLSLLREAARDLLEIPADASEEEVRRRCLEVLEEEEFQPGDDLGTAIRMLCAVPPPVYRPEEAGSQYRQRVDRLVRRELENAAVQLRTKPGELVQAALAELEPVAALSRSGRLWHRRLVTIANASFQVHLKTADQQKILRALLAIETTWPGEAVEVRRTYLAQLTPTNRLVQAARALEKQHPCVKWFDPAFLKALLLAPPSETLLPPKSQLDATDDALRLTMRMRRSSSLVLVLLGFLERLSQLFTFATLLIVAGVAMLVGLMHDPAPPESPSQRAAPGVSTPTASLPVRSPPIQDRLTNSYPVGFLQGDKAVYAPLHPPAEYALAPGEIVTVIGFEAESLNVRGPDGRKGLILPAGDFLREATAMETLRSRRDFSPYDPLTHLAVGNLERQQPSRGSAVRAEKSFEAVRKLDLTTKPRFAGGGVVLYVPLEDAARDRPADVPPPPPLATLFEGAAP